MRKRAPRKLAIIRPSHRNELWLRSELRAMVGVVRDDVERHLLPSLKPAFPGTFSDSSVPVAKDIIAKIRAENLGKMSRQAEVLARAAANRSLAAVDERFAKALRDSVSVDIKPFLQRNPRIVTILNEKTENNTKLITTIPTVYLDQVQNSVETNWGEGIRWEDLVDDISERGDVSEARAGVIARDQTSKLNAAFNQARQDDAGIDEYEWSTAGDESVRPSHADLDGTTHRWDEPGPLAGTIGGEPCHPGEDIECRCGAIPYINLETLESRIEIMEAEAA
jgi:SPP1 gp7 family putative phage head morphogenesis protein